MKLHKVIFLLMLAATVFSACTHNDGDIGPLFGFWKVVDVQYENMEPTYSSTADEFWAFQDKIVRFSRTWSQSSNDYGFGEYELFDNTLHLDVSDESHTPPLGLPRVCDLQVIELSGSKMILRYNKTLDSSETITFKKW